MVLPPGSWCEQCGRPEVFDGGWLCADCAWIRGYDEGGHGRGERGATAAEIPPWALTDREWASTLHLLTSPMLVRKGVMEHVDFARCTINVPRLLRVSAPWSSSERAMLRAACDLFNSGGKVGLSELLSSLDDGSLRCVLEAIELRRGLHSFSLAVEEGL